MPDANSVTTGYSPRPDTRDRSEIPERYRWDLEPIYPDWSAWEADLAGLETQVDELAAYKGKLAEGEGDTLLEFLRRHDEVGMVSYRLWYYPSLAHDTDQRNNELDARRQQVQELFSRFNTAISWYSPELKQIGLEAIERWMQSNEDLALYRFHLEELFRQAEHVLDEQGEHILSLASRFGSSPATIFSMLTTADADFPVVELSDGKEVTVSPASYGSMLRTLREHEDRKRVFNAHYERFKSLANTHAAIYGAVLQRGWFHARARGYDSVLGMKLHGNAIPEQVVTTLIDTAKAGAGPLRDYHALRQRVLGLKDYDLYDGFAPLVDFDPRYGYDEVQELVLESVKPLGEEYGQTMRRAFGERWIDVYENEGKRSGAYSASVYGVHPYMLLNYQDTLDDVFTLAHELGHTMHSILSDEAQPFVYHSYTIFVAEVASTLNEALLLDLLLERSSDPRERALLLQHTIDSIAGTFYTQALFAAFELEAHRAVESGEPVTAESLHAMYYGLLREFYGDGAALDPLYKATWARIPHFVHSPFYVYQYATCHAASATLLKGLRADSESERHEATERYLGLLRAGGSDHPMELLRKAGADLGDPETVRAVVGQMKQLVGQLETELEAIEG